MTADSICGTLEGGECTLSPVALCYNLTEGNKLMSDTKVKMIVVDSGELYVFGKLISRHPEMPWLFSITDVYKACEVPLKREAKKYGKDPEKVFTSKRPSPWVQNNIVDETVDAVAGRLRKRIKKYGVNCGFSIVNTEAVITASISNRNLCIQTKRGGSTKGLVKAVQGTYVAQDFIVDYAGFLNAKLKASINSTFISVLNGYTEEVTKKVEKNERIAKGTQTRIDNIQLNHALVEACGLKQVLPMKVQQGVNEGVLGMTATKYKKTFGIKEPFNDNLSKDQLDMKNTGISLATYTIRNHHKSKLSGREGQDIARASGVRAKFIHTNPELIDRLIAKSKETE